MYLLVTVFLNDNRSVSSHKTRNDGSSLNCIPLKPITLRKTLNYLPYIFNQEQLKISSIQLSYVNDKRVYSNSIEEAHHLVISVATCKCNSRKKESEEEQHKHADNDHYRQMFRFKQLLVMENLLRSNLEFNNKIHQILINNSRHCIFDRFFREW